MTLQDEILETFSRIPDLATKRLVIWGAGGMARQAYLLAQSLRIEVLAFVDGTEETSGQSLFGRPILALDQLQTYVDEGALIAVASTWWREIGVDLINRGLNHGSDFFIMQRRLSSIEWNKDIDDPNPVFIGRRAYNYEGLLAHYLLARPHYIGAFGSFALGSKLVVNHCHNAITSHPFITHKKWGLVPEDHPEYWSEYNPPTVVGNDVWLGYNACLLPGITIGNGAIIGANSVVTKDVPAYAIAVGAPAKVIRFRFDEQQIALLEAVQWWSWSDRRLQIHIDDFREPRRFFRLAEQIVAERGPERRRLHAKILVPFVQPIQARRVQPPLSAQNG